MPAIPRLVLTALLSAPGAAAVPARSAHVLFANGTSSGGGSGGISSHWSKKDAKKIGKLLVYMTTYDSEDHLQAGLLQKFARGSAALLYATATAFVAARLPLRWLGPYWHSVTAGVPCSRAGRPYGNGWD